MKITSKGQVTIPQDIREKAGLHPNTEAEFAWERGRVILRPAGKRASKGERLVQGLKDLGKHRSKGPTGRMTTDQLMELLRGKAD
jgi:AbrB family looped-hinge helix DNA binding protein